MLDSTILADMTDHQETALSHVEAVRAARHSLRELYRDPHRDGRDVAQVNAELGDALKLADVFATLAVAEELAELVDVAKLWMGAQP